MNRTPRKIGSGLAAAVVTVAALGLPAQAHHSFSMFDDNVTRVFTGVVTRVSPDVNHLQLFFAPMTEDRKGVERNAKNEPVQWAVEMAGSAAAAREGISVDTFPRGTVISLALHPLRSGDPGGNRQGALFKCPSKPNAAGEMKPVPPPAGKHCDSVEGRQAYGGETLAAPRP